MLRFKSIGRRAVLFSMAAMFVTLPGCGSKVTADNFAKIQPGQTQAQVEDLLGKPTSTETQSGIAGSGTKEQWKDGDKVISVGFLDGKVMITDKSGF